jgi:Methyltransferase domain
MSQASSLADYAAMHVQKLACGAPQCKVCRGPTRLFDVLDFNRQCALNSPYPDGLSGIPVHYHQCTQCQFIFTAFFDDFGAEQWVEHVYNADYARIDPEFDGTRALRTVAIVKAAMRPWWQAAHTACDYGGGKGLMAAALRQQGYAFNSTDPFGDKHGSTPASGYDMLTAFEVLEHFPQPAESFAQIVELCNTERCLMLLSTNLVDPKLQAGSLVSWWYAAPRNGHISLYAEGTMQWLAQAHGMQYKRISTGLHLFGKCFDLNQVARRVLQAKILQKLKLI